MHYIRLPFGILKMLLALELGCDLSEVIETGPKKKKKEEEEKKGVKVIVVFCLGLPLCPRHPSHTHFIFGVSSALEYGTNSNFSEEEFKYSETEFLERLSIFLWSYSDL